MKKYLIAGLLVWLPLAITIAVLVWAFGLVDGVFGGFVQALSAVLPARAVEVLQRLDEVPGVGLLVVLAVLLLTGVAVTNYIGQWSLRQWDRLLGQIPIVKSVYSSVKQVSDTLFSSSGNAFREAVLVEYPRRGAWTIAFVTGQPAGELISHLPAEAHVSLYVPTTPNPTSGFYLIVPRAEVKPLGMNVDAALKHIISMGVVAPPEAAAPAALPPAA